MARLSDYFAGKRIVISGAASGIGRDLALLLGSFGAHLALCDRQPEPLDALAAQLTEAGVEVRVRAVDVTDRGAMEAMAEEVLRRWEGVVDIVVGNAGVGGLNPADAFDLEIHRRTVEVNCLGLAHTLMPYVPAMMARGTGQLAGVCSMAGFRGLPNAASYSSTKAAQGVFLESLRVDLRKHGIAVTRIHPGFVQTPMTEHDEFKMPFMVPVRRSSLLIARALRRRRAVYLYPWPMRLLTYLNRLLPPFVYDRLVPRLTGQRREIEAKML